MIHPERFAGKVAIVTGGSTGIGRAIAKQFVCEGGKVVIASRHDVHYEAITKDLGAENCLCKRCDVSVRADVDALVTAAYDRFGGFDVMFGNAGINLAKDFIDFTEEEHDKIMNTNYKGCFNSTQAAARAFVAHETAGAIVNTASINVRLATPNTTPYAATKGAVAALTRGAAVELGKYGIRCNCVAPGVTDTPMNGKIVHDRFPNYTAPKLVLPRMASPEEIASVACFLASDEASYITGEIIFAAGGWGNK